MCPFRPSKIRPVFRAADTSESTRRERNGLHDFVLPQQLRGCFHGQSAQQPPPWEITYQEFDEDDLDNCSLYLKVDGKEYLLRDLEYWRQGRPSLPLWEVSRLYEDLLQAIFQQLRLCPDIAALDLDEIEGDILRDKYAIQWLEKEYVEPDFLSCLPQK